MELTLPPGTLDKEKENLAAFYGDVFGFEGIEVPMVPFDCPKYLLKTDQESSQFFFLVENENALVSKSYDHIGFLLDSRDEVDYTFLKCKDWQRKDNRVEILEYEDMDAKMVITHSYYVRYILPIWIDVQCLEFQPGYEPKRSWKFE